MKVYYESKNYSKAIQYAELILEKDQSDEEVRSDAKIFIARSALKVGDEKRAATAYSDVLETAMGKLKAEALYYEAYFKNKAEDYEASTAIVQDLTKNYSRYRTYGVKGLLLMAKNFNAMGDNYNATYILENIIKNFQSFPEAVAEAEELLKEIKSEAAKTNSSVEVDQN